MRSCFHILYIPLSILTLMDPAKADHPAMEVVGTVTVHNTATGDVLDKRPIQGSRTIPSIQRAL